MPRRLPFFLALVALCSALALSLSSPTPAAELRQPSLHVYMTGKQVKGLQWLLSGHRPSHFRFYKTYRGPIDGRYGKTTRLAVKQMKYRLGYPRRDRHGHALLNGRVAGRYFFAVLKGQVNRPVEWKGIAWQRTKQIRRITAERSTCVDEILAAARSVGFGFKETWGANWGPQVVNFQAITHHSYHAAWCVSFAQWVNVHAGIGPIADGSAGVNYVYNWANRRGWVHSYPRPGAWVAFGYSHSTHMGVVESVTRYGYYSIEGNHNGGVFRVYHGLHDNYPVFLWQPCILPR